MALNQGSYQPNNLLPQPNFLQQAMQSLYSPQNLDNSGPQAGALPGLPKPPMPGGQQGMSQDQQMRGVGAMLRLFKPKQQYAWQGPIQQWQGPVMPPDEGGDDNG